MTGLKLSKLPERNPVRITISLAPALHQDLEAYAALYAERYGAKEPVSELVPAMIATFLETDKAFRQQRKGR